MPTTYTTARAPHASQSGVSILADTHQLADLARDLRRAAPEAWKACRVELRAAGQLVADDAKARASYSTRIPGSIKPRSTAAGNVRISYGGDAAPNAVPIHKQGPRICSVPDSERR